MYPTSAQLSPQLPRCYWLFVQLGVGHVLFTVLGYVVVNVVIGNVIEPRVLGRGMGLSTLVVFISLVFWGWVLGSVGMFLSVPLTMIVKIELEHNEDTRWIAVLLG
jgi:predicted PurR-regulated permease PerM